MDDIVAVTIRTLDGNEHRMCRGAGRLHEFLERLGSHGAGCVEDYLAEWNKLKTSAIYASRGSLSPDDGCLLVLDMPSKTLLTAGIGVNEVDGYKIRRFDENDCGEMAELKKAVQDLGFGLSEGEKTSWKTYLDAVDSTR